MPIGLIALAGAVEVVREIAHRPQVGEGLAFGSVKAIFPVP
jgi:hypothetical protein